MPVDLNPEPRPEYLPPDASEIADALRAQVRWLFDGSPRGVAHELVVPVTAERADLAVFGDSMWLLEIKSGRDSLRRLQRQAEAFSRIADRCVLVAAARHLDRALEALPHWWGVMAVSEPHIRFRWERPAGQNPNTDRRSLLLMLRREEAAEALERIDGRSRRGRRRMSLLAEIDRMLDDLALRRLISTALAERAIS